MQRKLRLYASQFFFMIIAGVHPLIGCEHSPVRNSAKQAPSNTCRYTYPQAVYLEMNPVEERFFDMKFIKKSLDVCEIIHPCVLNNGKAIGGLVDAPPHEFLNKIKKITFGLKMLGVKSLTLYDYDVLTRRYIKRRRYSFEKQTFVKRLLSLYAEFPTQLLFGDIGDYIHHDQARKESRYKW